MGELVSAASRAADSSAASGDSKRYTASESEARSEEIVEPSEIDGRPGETLIVGKFTFGRLIANLEAESDGPDRRTNAPESRRPDGGPAADEVPREDVVLEIDKLPVSR